MILLIPILVFVGFLVICALMTVGEPLNPTRPMMPHDQAREYANRLQKMIECETVSSKEGFDDTEFAKLRQVMEKLFPQVHRRCRKLTFGEDCWVYFLPGQEQSRNILLMSHHDVVKAEGNWQYPAFSGTIAEGKIWGRGTVDTKTPLFAMFSALEELLCEGFVPKCNVWIASSHEEEIAGDGIRLAAEYFREQGIRFEFVLDEGGAVIDPPMAGMTCSKCAMVAIHEKGRHPLTLTAQEGSGHNGLASAKRATPTERMADFISECRRGDIFVRRMSPELESMFKAMAPYTAFPLKLIFANLWLFKPILVKKLPDISPQAAGLLGTTCSFNDLVTEQGGKLCTARTLLRPLDASDFRTDLTKLRTLATKHGILITNDGASEIYTPTDPKQPAFAKIARCIRSVFPDVPVIPFILPAGTDARVLTDLSPCVLRFAPLRLSAQQLASVHGENENVDISSVGAAVIFYRRVLEDGTIQPIPEDLDDDYLEEEWEEETLEPETPEMTTEMIPEEPEEDFLAGISLDMPEEPDTYDLEDFTLEEELPEQEAVFAQEDMDFTDLSEFNLELSDDDLLNWEEAL